MTGHRPEVLVSVTMLRPEEKSLLTAMRRRGLHAVPALAEDIGDVLNGTAPRPAAVVMRNLSHHQAVGLAGRLVEAGIPTLNTKHAMELCFDKGRQALAFATHAVPHPRSRHAFNPTQVLAAAEDFGWPAVVKPVSGSWGRGVVRLDGATALTAWAGGLETADTAGKSFPVLVQEHVDKPDHDLRVVVVGTEPVAAICRRSTQFRTNTRLGGEVEPVPVTDEIRELCKAALVPLGPGFYGLDLIRDRTTGRLLLLEANATPEFARSSLRHGVDVAGLVADLVAEHVRSGVSGF